MAYLFDQFPRSLDAFGRYRTSQPVTLFDSKMIADAAPLYWDDAVLSGAGTSSTYVTNNAAVQLGVSNLTAGARARQTFRSFNYQPGKSQLIFMTFVLGANAAGITRRVGYFNANNGLFLQQAGAVLSVVRRTFVTGVPVDNAVSQASWNLDKLDGSGPAGGNPSGITLDPATAQILIIDFEWLGVGNVRFGFVLDGTIVYCHEMDHANVLSGVYMSSANLPLRCEIQNDGTGPAASLLQICASVASEGGRDRSGIQLAVDRGATPIQTANDANLYPAIAIRLKSAYQFASVIANQISVMCTSTASFRWALLLNPIVAGTAFSFTSVATGSAVEADVTRTNTTTVSGGTLIQSGYSQAQQTGELQQALVSDLQLGATIAGVSDVLVLAVQRVSGTTETFYASLGWNEVK